MHCCAALTAVLHAQQVQGLTEMNTKLQNEQLNASSNDQIVLSVAAELEK
jgi:hypothetical protein